MLVGWKLRVSEGGVGGVGNALYCTMLCHGVWSAALCSAHTVLHANSQTVQSSKVQQCMELYNKARYSLA